MRFSTCSTEISLSIRPSTFSSRWRPSGSRARLLVGDLDREVRGDRVGELGVVVDLGHGGDDLGRDLLVELHIALELVDDRAGERLGLDLVAERSGERLGLGLVIIVAAV